MNSLEYLYPNNPVEQIIIALQLLLFLIWLILVILQYISLQRTSREIKSCDSISSLSKQNAISPPSNESEALARLKVYCGEVLLPDKSPIYSHIKTLYRAGFFQGNLDVQALINNTTSVISGFNHILRSILSLFIVLGLLGTLFGLATSLAHLPANLGSLPTSGDNPSVTNGVLSEGFQTMLESLGSAFTPSLTGVLLTVLGVLIITVLQKRMHTVSLLLEQETLSDWLLYLYPTTPQHLSNQLTRSEKQLKENFDAAKKVAEFAGDIRNDAEGLREEINETRTKFKDLRTASENLVKFSESFSESTHNFPGFQNELRDLNKQVLVDSKLLHVTIGNSLKRMDEGFIDVLNSVNSKLGEFLIPLQTNFNQSLEDNKGFLDGNRSFLSEVRDHFSQQNEFFDRQYSEQKNTLEVLFQSFKSYEETYISTRKTIDETLINTLSAVESASEKLGTANEAVIRGLIEAIGDPLKAEVTSTMQEIVIGINTIPADLSTISKKLGQINIPLEKASERMSAITEKFDSRTENFVRGLRDEFASQNKQNHEYIQDLNKVNTTITSLNSNLLSLSAKLDSFNQNLGKTRSASFNSQMIEKPSLGSGRVKLVKRKRFYQRIFGYFRK